MFHLLRKLSLLIFAGLCVWLGIFVYQKRSVFSPIIDLAEALEASRERPRQPMESVSGKVLGITGEYSFQMKAEAGAVFNFQLAGIEPISSGGGAEKSVARLKQESRAYLTQRILSNSVRVAATFLTVQRAGLGVVYAGETNLNAALVEAGLARLNRSYLKSLPLGEIYPLLRAERKAKERKLGFWEEASAEN
ncbi:MAG: thermonuclease family protein [Verrucomicrobia bacterium]|nr:thermonuclease family protein [Verrucomicrobiota bacterium]